MPSALEKLREIRAASDEQSSTGAAVKRLSESGNTAKPGDTEYTELPETLAQPANLDVLNILIRTGRPMPHSEIVKALTEGGQRKDQAKAEIAHCQREGRIYHNLVTGYEVVGAAEAKTES